LHSFDFHANEPSQGTWGSVFYKGSNEKRPFYVAEKEPTAVEFMVKAEQMFYYEDENVQVVDLPYQSNKWFARIVLPKKSLAENGKYKQQILLDSFLFIPYKAKHLSMCF
jgi:serine protease inhibitor